MTENKIPPPGHPHAVAPGCLCPVLDNAHGEGSGYFDTEGNRQHWVNSQCTVHVEQEEK